MYNKITNTTKEEKEHALSLLRIPLNFFSEDDKKVTTKNNEEVKIDSDTTSSPLTKRKINAEDNNSTIHINISEDLEFTQTNQPSSSSKSFSISYPAFICILITPSHLQHSSFPR